MTITFLFRESIWPCIGAGLNHLQSQRGQDVPQEVRAGVNFSIILGAACYLEGCFESALKALLEHQRGVYNKIDIPEFETRRSMNVFYNRMEEDLAERIAAALGATGYDEMFELLLGRRLSSLHQISPLWEGVTVLFKFRNVLGHGRQVEARHVSAYSNAVREEFSGGYRATEDYLKRRQLLDKKFTDHHSEYLYLSNPTADHFWELAQMIPRALTESLEGAEREAVKKVLLP
jgi:hypothetical protein